MELYGIDTIQSIRCNAYRFVAPKIFSKVQRTLVKHYIEFQGSLKFKDTMDN